MWTSRKSYTFGDFRKGESTFSQYIEYKNRLNPMSSHKVEILKRDMNQPW